MTHPVDILPQPDPIIWKPLDPCTAAEFLRYYGNTEHPEPSLPVILAMLCHTGAVEGIHADPNTDYQGSVPYWRRRFFTLPRVQRILRAVISGDAGERVVEILQFELEQKGFCTAGTLGFWMVYTGWMKCVILDCFDPEAFKAFKEARGLPALASVFCTFDLQTLLNLPLRFPVSGEVIHPRGLTTSP